MEEKRMEMNEAVVMNEEELVDVNGGGILAGAAIIGACYVGSYVAGYVVGKVVSKKTGVCKA